MRRESELLRAQPKIGGQQALEVVDHQPALSSSTAASATSPTTRCAHQTLAASGSAAMQAQRRAHIRARQFERRHQPGDDADRAGDRGSEQRRAPVDGVVSEAKLIAQCPRHEVEDQ